MAEPSKRPGDEATTFMSHLLELRNRIMRGGASILVVFLIAAPFANDLYEYLAAPLMDALPEGNSMISTEPLYQLWAFVAPGLYRHEKRLTVPLLVSSSILFYLGILFAYYAVFPIIFAFFTSTAPEGVLVMTDINAYLSFVLKLFFAFGLAFEVPVATVLMVKVGMTTPESLASKRPYIIVGAFVVGMVMTPPDIFSQTMLAVPVWLLFEAGLYCSRMIKSKETESGQDLNDQQA